jgi:DNA-binding protein HU-beta
MTKADFIKAVHDKVDGDFTKKDVEFLVDTTFSTIKSAILKDKRMVVSGFGTFNVRKRKARKGRNPQTGKPIEIPARKAIVFKPTPSFKDAL